MRAADRPIGTRLVQGGIISPRELERALEYQRAWSVPLGRALVELSACEEAQVVRALGAQLGVNWVHLSRVEVSAGVLARVPARVARTIPALPLAMAGTRLVVAMAHPADLDRIEMLRFASSHEVIPVLAGDRDLAAAIGRHYPADAGEVTPTVPTGQRVLRHTGNEETVVVRIVPAG